MRRERWCSRRGCFKTRFEGLRAAPAGRSKDGVLKQPLSRLFRSVLSVLVVGISSSWAVGCGPTDAPRDLSPRAGAVDTASAAPSVDPVSPAVSPPAAGQSPTVQAATQPATGRHARWDAILRSVVTGEGWVDYSQLQSRFRGELATYLKELATTRLADLASAVEKKAFWINAYNAVCVQLVLDHGVPAEVPHSFFLGKNIFKEEKYTVGRKVRSLEDIEHRILRQEFADSRIHAAIVCAASSCPRLRPEAFSALRLDAQLDEECRRWVNRGTDKKGRRKNFLDQKRKVFFISKIFSWFEDDFGGGNDGVRRFLQRFADPPTRTFLEQYRVELEYLDYDWSTNIR